MSVADWNTDPNLNTTVGGVFIGEGCPPSNLNNAERAIMAEAKAKFNALDAATGGLGTPSLSALAALTPAADKLPYYSGPTTGALADLTPFARTLLAGVDAATVAGLIGAVRVSSFTPGVNGILSLLLGGANLMLQWGTQGGFYTEGSYTLSFNTAFPTNCWNVFPGPITPSSSNTNDYSTQLIDGTVGLSSCLVMVQKEAASGSGLSGINWWAIGN